MDRVDLEIKGLKDRVRVLERTAGDLESQCRILKERLNLLSKQVYTAHTRTEEGNIQLEARQAEIERWAEHPKGEL